MPLMMEMTLAERLQKVKAHFNLSFRAMGVMAGVSGQQIINIIEGKTTNPKKSLFDKLSNQLGISYQWLATGEGEMFANKKSEPIKNTSDDLADLLGLTEEEKRNPKFQKAIEKLELQRAQINMQDAEINFLKKLLGTKGDK